MPEIPRTPTARKTSLLLLLLLLLLPMLLTGCQSVEMRKAQAADEAVAKEYVALLRQHRFSEIEEDASPGILGTDADYKLTQMAGVFPAGEPTAIKTVAWSPVQHQGYSIDLEYQFPGNAVLVELNTQYMRDRVWITGWMVQPLTAEPEDINRFTLRGKGETHYEVLGLALTSFGFSIYAFVLCLRTRMPRHKWFWVLLTLLGVGLLGVNWTTGEAFYALFFICIPTLRVVAYPYGPWTIAASFPLGAVVSLLQRRRLLLLRSDGRMPPAP